MIHTEELEIELIKMGSVTHVVTFEVRTRARHEKTQGDIGKMIVRPVQAQSCKIIEHTCRNVACAVGTRSMLK